MDRRIEELVAEIVALADEDQKHLLRLLSSGVRDGGVDDYLSSPGAGRVMKSVYVRLPDDLAREALAAGLLADKPLEEIIRRALRDQIGVSDGSRRTPAQPVRLPIYQGKGGVAKGIDPLSNRSMMDAAGDDTSDP